MSDYTSHNREADTLYVELFELLGEEPGIVLIVGEGEETYLQRLYSLIRAYELPIRVWVVSRRTR